MKELNPYLPIRKVPLDYNGIISSAFSVQMDKEKGWKEVGIVGHNYMLLPNEKVKEAAIEVANTSDLDWKHNKTFFDGKRFVYSLISDHSIGEVSKGDDVALGMQFWNSYDGSRAFGYSLMLYRLICLNGMMSKAHLKTSKFRHDPNNADWDKTLDTVINSVNTVVKGKSDINQMLKSFRSLHETKVDLEEIGRIRHEYLKEIPVGTWGQILDNYTNSEQEYVKDSNAWGLLNAATDILWHKEKPTMASYDQNAMIVDNICLAIA